MEKIPKRVWIWYKHLKGKEHQVVDALRRKVQCAYEIQYPCVEFDVTKHLKEAAIKDPEYKFLWQQTMQMHDWGKPNEYGIDDRELLNFKGRVYVPN